MITIAGKTYAEKKAEGDCVGIYRKQGNGLLLLDLQGVPFAYVARQGRSCWIVTAHRDSDGRTRYMFGLAEFTEKQLGILGLSYSEERKLAEQAVATAYNDEGV